MVLDKAQRMGLISIARPEPLILETFIAPTVEESDNLSFKVLLIIVGVLLLIVGGLMLANVYITKKSIHASIQDREQILRARVVNRQRQMQQQNESEDDSSESENQPPPNAA